eukprot:278524_1
MEFGIARLPLWRDHPVAVDILAPDHFTDDKSSDNLKSPPKRPDDIVPGDTQRVFDLAHHEFPFCFGGRPDLRIGRDLAVPELGTRHYDLLSQNVQRNLLSRNTSSKVVIPR